MTPLLVLLLQATDVAVPAGSVVQTSPWTPEKITALFGGIAVLLAAVFGGVTAILAQLRANKETEGKKLDKVLALVDGAQTRLLRKIAYLARAAANTSRRADDIKTADEAERDAQEQEARVAAALAAESKRG